jgi:hypothetical protein
LAIRSGQYKNIVVNGIKEGEIDYNPITEEINLHPIMNPVEREKAKTIGYYAAFELMSGFKKEMFATIENIQAHAKQYSKSYRYDIKSGKKSSVWSTNFDAMAGMSISVPIYDGRSTKTAVNKAKIKELQAKLDLAEEQKTLYATIQDYWLNVLTNQEKFRAAKASVESEQESYDLLQEQFRLGLKNIVELMRGKDNLLSAQQSQLQSKYLALYNRQMLKFYENGEIN